MASELNANNPNFTVQDIQSLQGLTGNRPTSLYVCKIEAINEDNTLEVSILSGEESNKIVHNVRVATPYKTPTSGIVFYPEVGAMGILLVINETYKFIISYFNMGDVLSSIGKQLDLGEIFLKTPFGSYIKMNNDNSIDIHTGSSTALFLDKDEIVEMSESKTSLNISKEVFSGVENNVVHTKEKYYDKDVSSSLSNSEILEEAGDLLYVDIPIEERNPILEISKGNVIDDKGNKVKLSIYESFNPEAAYRLEVKGNKSNFSLMIGKDGSAQIDANILKINCNELDLKGTPETSYKNIVFTKEDD